jgi:hypothetical protein
MLIVGVSYRLIPMFTLSEVQSQKRALGSILLLNAGLLGTFFAVLLRTPWKLVPALMLAGGLALYGLEMLAILRARKRRVLDWGVKYFLTAIGLLLPLGLLGVVLAWPRLPLTPFTGQLENAYGFLAIVGVVSLAIMGMLYKIIPFIVWYSRYSKQIGLAKVPSLADLYSAKLQMAGYVSYVSGFSVAIAGIIFAQKEIARVGIGLLLVAGLILVANVCKMLSHMLHRRTTPPMIAKPLRAASGMSSPTVQPTSTSSL